MNHTSEFHIIPCLRAVAKRSYPTSEVRGSGRECQAVMAQERQRGATPHSRSGGAAERSYSVSEVRGGSREEQPHTGGQGWQPGGAAPSQRPGAVAGRTNATS